MKSLEKQVIVEDKSVIKFNSIIKKQEDSEQKNNSQEIIKYSLSDIEKLAVSLSNEYEEMKPIITVGEAVFGVNGDISFFSGLPKAGKSTISRMVVATALMPYIPPECDTLSIRSEYCQGRKVIYLDTEQNPRDTQKMVKSILSIAGLKEQPSNFIALNLREFSHSENMDYLKSLFHHYNDAYLWIVDGVTDFIPSSNDETAGNILVRYLMKMSSINDTCIVCLIHENAGNTGKMRGHFGSEAARKCQGAVSIAYEEDKKAHSIKSIYLRNSKKIEPIYWQFNDSGRPVSCDAEMVESINKIGDDKNYGKNVEMIGILEKVYKNIKGECLTYDILRQKIILYAPSNPNSKNSKDATRKRNDRLFKSILDSSLLRIELEIKDKIERKVYYYDSQNFQLEF
jgi:hypothetical protein